MNKVNLIRIYVLLSILILFTEIFTGCSLTEKNLDKQYGLDPDEPTQIVVWHYYNGAQAIAFNAQVDEFNITVGKDKGILVSSESKSSIGDLAQAVQDSVDEKVGAKELPNIFQCYPDSAAQLEDADVFVNLDDYVTKEDKEEYIEDYVKGGVVNDKWVLFPVAKSTEVLMLNKTDWDTFSRQTGTSLDELSTWEGLTAAAEKYYNWSDGSSFFGRDAFANYMLVGSGQLGKSIFEVNDGKVTVNLDKDIMKKLWDNYYVPYIKGYFSHEGRYRTDDIKTGKIISMVCSTTSTMYFPKEVSKEGEDSYDIDYIVKKLPNFEGTAPYQVLQGADMAVSKSNETQEYASIVFLKWLTQSKQNTSFSVASSYLPVKKDANDFEKIATYVSDNSLEVSNATMDVIKASIEQGNESTLYYIPAFKNGYEARNIVGFSMIDLAVSDKAAIDDDIKNGVSKKKALKQYLSDEYFDTWYNDLKIQLDNVCDNTSE